MEATRAVAHIAVTSSLVDLCVNSLSCLREQQILTYLLRAIIPIVCRDIRPNVKIQKPWKRHTVGPYGILPADRTPTERGMARLDVRISEIANATTKVFGTVRRRLFLKTEPQTSKFQSIAVTLIRASVTVSNKTTIWACSARAAVKYNVLFRSILLYSSFAQFLCETAPNRL